MNEVTTTKPGVLAVMDAALSMCGGPVDEVGAQVVEARATVERVFRLVAEIDSECGNSKPDFARVCSLASEAAALAAFNGEQS